LNTSTRTNEFCSYICTWVCIHKYFVGRSCHLFHGSGACHCKRTSYFACSLRTISLACVVSCLISTSCNHCYHCCCYCCQYYIFLFHNNSSKLILYSVIAYWITFMIYCAFVFYLLSNICLPNFVSSSV